MTIQYYLALKTVGGLMQFGPFERYDAAIAMGRFFETKGYTGAYIYDTLGVVHVEYGS